MLGTALLIVEDDCPDRVAECPDNCEGAQCPRFLNAECQVNPCHGLCTPNFFRENGRNVTDNCDVERCSDKVCKGKRQCIEEIVPPSCPGNDTCRQYIKSRCVLPPSPTDCIEITCGPGMYCQRARRGKEATCARAQKCFQLTCDKGYVCVQMEEGPMCVMDKPSLCLKDCPEGTVCTKYSVPSRELVFTTLCLPQAIADRQLVYGSNFSCSSSSSLCNQRESCSEVFEDDHRLAVVCSIVNCTASAFSFCPHNHTCTDVPPPFIETLQLPFKKMCTPPGFAFNKTCATAVDPCPASLACHDIVFKEVIIGITCERSAPLQVGASCAELECPAPLECVEIFTKGVGSIAKCTVALHHLFN